MDVHTKEKRSFNMSKIKSENTKPEVAMFSLLKKNGYQFKKHYHIFGKPDIAFPKQKIAIFINGEFWHGKNYKTTKNKLPVFWIKKIRDNIRRDRRNSRLLRKKRWHIINIWGNNLIRNPERTIKHVINLLKKWGVSE